MLFWKVSFHVTPRRSPELKTWTFFWAFIDKLVRLSTTLLHYDTGVVTGLLQSKNTLLEYCAVGDKWGLDRTESRGWLLGLASKRRCKMRLVIISWLEISPGLETSWFLSFGCIFVLVLIAMEVESGQRPASYWGDRQNKGKESEARNVNYKLELAKSKSPKLSRHMFSSTHSLCFLCGRPPMTFVVVYCMLSGARRSLRSHQTRSRASHVISWTYLECGSFTDELCPKTTFYIYDELHTKISRFSVSDKYPTGNQ